METKVKSTPVDTLETCNGCMRLNFREGACREMKKRYTGRANSVVIAPASPVSFTNSDGYKVFYRLDKCPGAKPFPTKPNRGKATTASN